MAFEGLSPTSFKKVEFLTANLEGIFVFAFVFVESVHALAINRAGFELLHDDSSFFHLLSFVNRVSTSLPLAGSESLLEIIDQLTLARRSEIFFDKTS